MRVLRPDRPPADARAPHPYTNPWLLLALQLPARPSNGRVKTWRRLQQLGALSLKGSLYLLPNSAQALEDFEWIRAEVEAFKGQANIFTAASAGGLNDRQIVEQFRTARDEDYRALIGRLRALHTRLKRPRGVGDRDRDVQSIGERLDKLRAIDYYSAPLRDFAEREFAAVQRLLRPAPTDSSGLLKTRLSSEDYQSRSWVTRPRPGVDRLSSAWLISRFIDRHPTFLFASDPGKAPQAVPFDMYGAGFAHEGDLCTFEVLRTRFGVADHAVQRLGEIVHDLDLKEERFRPPQAAGVAVLVDGLRLALADDHELLRQGIAVFEAIYRGLRSQTPLPRRRAKLLRSPGGSK